MKNHALIPKRRRIKGGLVKMPVTTENNKSEMGVEKSK